MKSFYPSIVAVLVVLVSATAPRPVAAAPQAPPASASAPTLMRIDGALKTPTGEPRTGNVLLVASVYTTQDDSTPLWLEYQTVTLDAAGRYTLVVGDTLDDGIPKELFLTSSGRWLGIAVQGEAEQPRIMLVTVPYALKAREADTLAGRFFSDFVLSDQLKDSVKAVLKADQADGTAPGILGTTNRIVKFDGSGNATADSSIFDDGNIGVGTASPANKLHVFANNSADGILLDGAVNPNLVFASSGTAKARFGLPTGANAFLAGAAANDMVFRTEGATKLMFGTSATAAMTIDGSQKVGIGTTAPENRLHIFGVNSLDGIIIDGATNPNLVLASSGTARARIGLPVGANAFLAGAAANDLVFRTEGATKLMFGTNATSAMTIDASQNIGIGTTAPIQKLDVAGSINVSGNINAKYQDVAEWVETPTPLDAGTVVIVDPLESNRVLQATRAYDTRVAGAVSRQPGLLLGERSDTKAMVAQSGRVRVKVDAKYGAIRIGDLLVTSPTPGHAMRSRPMRLAGGQSLHRPGTLVGKALESLAKGQGEVLVLLTLQ